MSNTRNYDAAFKKAKQAEKAAKEKRDSLELELKSYLSIKSQVAGLEQTPKRFSLLGPDGKRTVLTCSLQHRSSYTVAVNSSPGRRAASLTSRAS